MEATQRRVPIIAVFGSTVEETLELAKLIGVEIARQNGILLTGGEGIPEDAVKEWAITGAESVRSESCLGAWIGVPRDKSKRIFVPNPNDLSGKIYTGLNHKRNYIEAWLCDAAIALEGGEGTRSEITFCLSLQKPVVRIGNWKTKYPLDQPETLNKLVTEAFMLIDGERNSILDELLNKEAILANLQSPPKDRKDYLMPSETDRSKVAADAVGDAFAFLEPFRETGLKGTFPELEAYKNVRADYDSELEAYKNVRADYDSWLRRIEERITAT